MTTITIHGRNFKGPGFLSGPSSIHVGPANGPTNVTEIVVVSDTEIRCKLPPKDPAWPATVGIWITTPLGVGSKAGVFHYLPPPVLGITSVSPSHGPSVGGTVVTLTGDKFTNVDAIWLDVFGELTSIDTFTVDSQFQITMTMPSGLAYVPFGIRLRTTEGEIYRYRCDNPLNPAWYYDPPPSLTVSAITPNFAGSLAGMLCTLTGTGFVEIGLDDVSMEALSSIGFTVIDDTTATFTMPDAASMFVGPYYEAGGNPKGYTTLWLYHGATPTASIPFQWYSLTINEVGPAEIPSSGGTVIDIYGYSLDTITLVEIYDDTNGGPAFDVTASLVIIDHTHVQVTSPALVANASAGRVRLYGVDEGGGFVEGVPTEISGALTFTPGQVPAAPLSLDVTSGPDTGGTSIVVEVVDSTGLTGIYIGSELCTSFAIVDATHVSGDTPAQVAGAYPVAVANAYGSGAQLADGFTYV
jgi:hypothetical protein